MSARHCSDVYCYYYHRDIQIYPYTTVNTNCPPPPSPTLYRYTRWTNTLSLRLIFRLTQTGLRLQATHEYGTTLAEQNVPPTTAALAPASRRASSMFGGARRWRCLVRVGCNRCEREDAEIRRGGCWWDTLEYIDYYIELERSIIDYCGGCWWDNLEYIELECGILRIFVCSAFYAMHTCMHCLFHAAAVSTNWLLFIIAALFLRIPSTHE